MGLFYRLSQFWQVWRARPLHDEARQAVTAVLTTAEIDLFDQFSLSDQQHSYQVMHLLTTTGHTQPDLLTAALLHDVGKTRVPLSIWERSLIVVGRKLLPHKAEQWGQGDVGGWQRPFVVKAQHPAWGAEMARAAGSSPLAVALIQRHQDPLPETAVTDTDQLLRLLQWADDQN